LHRSLKELTRLPHYPTKIPCSVRTISPLARARETDSTAARRDWKISPACLNTGNRSDFRDRLPRRGFNRAFFPPAAGVL
jgi:hypothetical protein